MKRAVLTVLVCFLLVSSALVTMQAVKVQGSSLDNTLAVFVGTHPDDIEIGMSGSLYQNFLGKHPILWVVVTDGGADQGEYDYESSQGWIGSDGQYSVPWTAPDGTTVYRDFYSADLAEARCGGYFNGLTWVSQPSSHWSSTFDQNEYDWRTEVSDAFGSNVAELQLSYLNPKNSSQRLSYPDGATSLDSSFTSSIASNLAEDINAFVKSNGYNKNLIYIDSHAPDAVATNANEHPDHEVVGNAVLQAINILQTTYGFGQVDAAWQTIYSPVQPQPGYTQTPIDILQSEDEMVDLAQTCWETDYIYYLGTNFCWNNFPEDPGQYEYAVYVNYAPSASVVVTGPTGTSPAYTRSGLNVNVGWNYSETNPVNATITIQNATATVGQTFVTLTTGGNNIARLDPVSIYSGTSDGAYNVNVAMYDAAGDVIQGASLSSVIVDNTSPTVSIVYPAKGAYLNSSTVWINGTVTDANIGSNTPSINATGFTLSGWNATSGKFSFKNTSVSDGTLSVKVTFMDMANNTGSASTYFTVDTTKPVMSITYPSAGAYLNSSIVWINGTVTDADVGANQPSINDSRFALQYWNANTDVFGFKNSSSVSDGTLSVTVNFTDLAGNTGNASESFTLDTTAPVLSITYPSAGAYLNSSTVWINGTVTEANAGSNQPLINDSRFTLLYWNAGTLSFGFKSSSLTVGFVSVIVSFADLAGNTGNASTFFTVDTTAPVVNIAYPTEGAYVDLASTVWVNGTVTELNMGALEPSINDTRFSLAWWNSGTGGFGFSNNTAMSEGSVSVMVSFTDLAGNTGTDTVTFSLGDPTPVCLVVQGLDNGIYYRTSSGGSLGGWNVLPGATCDSPAAAVYQDNLCIVVRGMDGSTLWYGSVDLSTNVFTGWSLLDGATPSAPTLTSNGTVLCLVVRGEDNSIYYRCYNGSWGSWFAVPTGSTPDSPSAAMLGNNLHIVVRGMDGSSLWDVIVACNGTVVRGWEQLQGATNARPALSSSQDLDELYLVVTGLDNRIYFMNYTGSSGSWGSWSAVPTGATTVGPAATVAGSELYTIVQGMDGSSIWLGYSNEGTSTFSGWTMLSGATPSAPTLTS